MERLPGGIGGKKTVVPTLRAHEDLQVIAHDEVFADQKTPDPVWLARAGSEGWWVLSRDAEIRRKRIELLEVERSRVGMFVLVGKDITGPEMAEAFEQALPRIRAFIARVPRPFIAKVHRDGSVRAWWPDHAASGSSQRMASSTSSDEQP